MFHTFAICHTAKFADDTRCSKEITSPETDCPLLQSHINDIRNWSLTSHLLLHESKTCFVRFCRHPVSEYDCDLYHLDGPVPLSWATTERRRAYLYLSALLWNWATCKWSTPSGNCGERSATPSSCLLPPSSFYTRRKPRGRCLERVSATRATCLTFLAIGICPWKDRRMATGPWLGWVRFCNSQCTRDDVYISCVCVRERERERERGSEWEREGERVRCILVYLCLLVWCEFVCVRVSGHVCEWPGFFAGELKFL